MAEVIGLQDAVRTLVRDGDSVALEGFTHLIPFAAGHEIVRQGRRDLELIRMTPDLIYDQLIGDGLRAPARVLVGRQPRRRLAAPPARRRRERLAAPARAGGAHARRHGQPLRGRRVARLPFARPARLQRHRPRARTNVRPITCPFTGEELNAVPALRPDVGIVHAQRADRSGNVQLWGIVGVQKEVVLASERSLVTVEEIVDELEPRPGAIVIPSWAITAVAEAPRGAHPSYAHSYYDRDNDFYKAWDAIARDRDTFQSWMQEHVQWHTAPTR